MLASLSSDTSQHHRLLSQPAPTSDPRSIDTNKDELRGGAPTATRRANALSAESHIHSPVPRDPLAAHSHASRIDTSAFPISDKSLSNACTRTLSSHLANNESPKPLSGELPLVILDLRPLQSFLDLRIAGSINLALPSLVIRRMRRSANPVSSRDSASLKAATSTNSPLAHLTTYITTTGGKRKFQHILDYLSASHSSPPLPTQPCPKSARRGLPLSTTDSRETNEESTAGPSSSTTLVPPSPLDLWKADIVVVCSEPSSARRNETTALNGNASGTGHVHAHSPAASSLEASQALCSALASLPRPADEEATRQGNVFLFDKGMHPIAEYPEAASWLTSGPDGEEFDPTAASVNATSPRESVASGAITGLSTLSLLSPSQDVPNARNDTRALPVLSTPSTRISSGSDSAMRLPKSLPVSASTNPASSPLNPTSQQAKKPGRPSLARLDTSEKVKTLGASGFAHRSATEAAVPALKIDVSKAQPVRPATAVATPVSPAGTSSRLSLQTLAHLQAQMPPSPATFSDMSLALPSAASPTTFSQSPWTRAQADRELARRGSVPVNRLRSDSETAPAFSCPDSLATSPGYGNSFSASSISSPNSEYYQASPMRCLSFPEAPVFDVSTILPSFLFLGPDITTLEEAEELQRKGVKRILNCAAEVSDKSSSVPADTSPGSDESPGSRFSLAGRFEKYLKIPMWDNVEAKGVQGHISQACAFLDDARLHDSPVYVHCRAGKSRSVSIVIAYLIHAHRWSLKKSYAYVVERRDDVSPNIGFVSCLMAFEDMTLNRKGPTAFLGSNGGNGLGSDEPDQSGEHDSSASGATSAAAHSSDKRSLTSGEDDGFVMPRHIRQSMPSIGTLLTPQTHTRSASPLSKAPVLASEEAPPSPPTDDADSSSLIGAIAVAPQRCESAAAAPASRANLAQHGQTSDGCHSASIRGDEPDERGHGSDPSCLAYRASDTNAPFRCERNCDAEGDKGKHARGLSQPDASDAGSASSHGAHNDGAPKDPHDTCPSSTSAAALKGATRTDDELVQVAEPTSRDVPKRRNESLNSPPQHTLPDAFASGEYDMEHRGHDGRYRNFRRGPVKEEISAPGRRATMAGLGKDSGVFAHGLQRVHMGTNPAKDERQAE